MERLKMMKENLMSCIQSQMSNLQNADAQELGEAVDMLKDIEEAMYYASIVKAMEESEQEHKYAKSYTYPPVMYSGDSMRYYGGDRDSGRTTSDRRSTSDGRMYYESDMYPISYPYEMRDYREGRSGITRRYYMESKELHHDTAKKMQELEEYMKELSEDIVEMVEGASPEEKQILVKKLSTLVDKIQ